MLHDLPDDPETADLFIGTAERLLAQAEGLKRELQFESGLASPQDVKKLQSAARLFLLAADAWDHQRTGLIQRLTAESHSKDVR